MASSKKKQEEESNLKTLREIVGLPHNKHCFDCNQRGPTYVNMTIGSFVCTACSGLLRGLNPPHRVKSISMASFSADEMEQIKNRGNEYCRRVWLGLYDHKVPFDIDSKDEGRMKELMSQRYERKRWYVQASGDLADECRRLNTTKPATTTSTASAFSSKITATIANSTNRPNSEPSHPFASPSIKLPQQLKQPQLPIQQQKLPTQQQQQLPTQQQQQQLPTQQQQQPQQQQPQQQQQNNKASFDLFSDFNNDLFNKPPSQQQPNSDPSGFADFSAFNAFPQQNAFLPAPNPQLYNPQQTSQLFNQLPFQQQQPPQHLPQQLPPQQQQQQPNSFAAQNIFTNNTSILLPNASQPHQQQQQYQQQQPPQQHQQNSDKYSALIGLNAGAATSTTTTSTAEASVVDWDGSRKQWMSTSHHIIPSLHHQPPPPSYNSLNFPSVSSQFGALSISSSTPHHSQQPTNYPTFYQQANGGVQAFGGYASNNLQGHNWAWMGAQTATHNPFAPHQAPPPTGASIVAPNNPNNPFL